MVKMAVKIAANRMVMLAVVCALVACGKSEDTSTTGAAASGAAVKPSLSVQLVRPLKQDWPLTLTAHGAIAPWQEAVIGAEVSGLRLMDVLVNVGDGVRKGQLLASLRADSLQADLAASRASVAEAQALLQEAQANAERARSLRQSDAVSAQEAQRALTGEQTAQARVDALKAQVARPAPAAAPASAKTETQINNENRAKEYKAQKAQEKQARQAEQASRKKSK